MSDKVTVFADEAGEWRWHRQSENGEIVATSGEGYVNKSHAEAMAAAVNGGEYHLVTETEES